jgi:hypothetical protein
MKIPEDGILDSKLPKSEYRNGGFIGFKDLDSKEEIADYEVLHSTDLDQNEKEYELPVHSNSVQYQNVSPKPTG